ncbi:MAG: class I SAM-dependent methyltransferase, partial [Acidimicrobiales bacterium]
MHRRSFDDLVDEAEAADVDGWDFSWLDGRATEERPPWGYVTMLSSRLTTATTVLDLDTGGGEVFAEALAAATARPERVVATESWPPNVIRAAATLAPRRVAVVRASGGADLPFGTASFDLISSRHPVAVPWSDLARVLRPGGTYLAQHVGPGTNAELTEYLMGPQPVGDHRRPQQAVAEAEAAGLTVVDLREATLTVEFFDIGAVIFF